MIIFRPRPKKSFRPRCGIYFAVCCNAYNADMSLLKPYFLDYLGFDFGPTDEKQTEINNFIKSARSEETVRKNDETIKKLKSFATDTGITCPLESMEKADLNQLLCSLIIQAKNNGENYEVTSMRSMFSLLGIFVNDIARGNVDQDAEYRGFCDVKRAKIKVLKAGLRF